MKILEFLLILVFLCSACNIEKSNKEEKISISVYNIGFECNVCDITEEKKVLIPYEMFIHAKIENNTDDTVWFGALCYGESLEIKQFGYFQLIDKDTITLNSQNDILDILPSGELDILLIYRDYDLLDKFVTINTIKEKNKIISILDNYKLIYRAIDKDYEEFIKSNPFPQQFYHVNFSNYWVNYTSEGKEYLSFDVIR